MVMDIVDDHLFSSTIFMTMSSEEPHLHNPEYPRSEDCRRM
jgi:hypothetical protein